MAVEIRTPFPSLESVAKAVGLPLKRAREIERMISGARDGAGQSSTASRRLAKVRRSGRRSRRR